VILFLTYHKVVRNSEGEKEFYTTSADQFERELDLLAASSLQPLTPEAVVEGRGSRVEGNNPSATLDRRHSYILSFDDGTEDHRDVVLPLLRRTKSPAIFFVPTAKLNQPGYLDSVAVRELSQAGHEIGLHGHEHRRLDDLTEEDIRVQFELSQNIIGELTGARPVWFAPPGGYSDSRVRALAQEAGVRASRTMRWGYNRNPNLAALECIPVNRYTSEAEFGQILKFQRSNSLYFAKEIGKKLLPSRFYECLRDLGRVRRS
jgi:peptidoglycan/xylan/chitin deacetylase (PgdA/CDA1 family)